MMKCTSSAMPATSSAAAAMPVTIACTGVILAASFSCAAPLRMPMKADSTAFTTCSGPALLRSGPPASALLRFGSTGAATIISVSPHAVSSFHLEKRVRQRHRVDVLRHPRVDHERNGHAPHFPRRQRLLREAEALELSEMARRDLRPVAGNRLPGHRTVGIVADLEGHQRERAGMDAHALLHRREGPRQVVAQVRVELDRDRAGRVDL